MGSPIEPSLLPVTRQVFMVYGFTADEDPVVVPVVAQELRSITELIRARVSSIFFIIIVFV